MTLKGEFLSFSVFGSFSPWLVACLKETSLSWMHNWKLSNFRLLACSWSHCCPTLSGLAVSLTCWVHKVETCTHQLTFTSILGSVRTKLGLLRSRIGLRFLKTQLRPIKFYVWALIFDWVLIKMDQKPIRSIKWIQIILVSIQHRIHEIWIAHSNVIFLDCIERMSNMC